MTPEPFSLHVPDEVLDDLRERLDRTRFPDEVPGSDWRLGTNLAYMRDLVDYWRDGFDWRAQDGLERGSAYWQAGWDWIAEQRVHRVRP